MEISKKCLIFSLLFLIISVPSQTNAMMGPQVNITDYKSIFTNFLRQGAESLQNAYSYIAASLSSALKTNPSTLTKTVSSQSTSLSSTPKWVILAGAVLIAGTVVLKTNALQNFLKYINSPKPLKQEPFDFKKLPEEIQKNIIIFLSSYLYMQDFTQATQTIKSLSLTDTQLNTLINEQQFCLTLIKNIARTFGVSDEKAARHLQVKGAQERVRMQEPLKLLCEQIIKQNDIDAQEKQLRELNLILKNENIDLNFTYMEKILIGDWETLETEEVITDPAYTPLILALRLGNYSLAQALLNDERCDINYITPKNRTVLIEYCRSEKNLLFLLKQKNIEINQIIPSTGDTVLTIAIGNGNYYYELPKILEILFKNGADPTITNKKGNSATSVLPELERSIRSPETRSHIVNLIQTAINKKNEKK